MICAREGTRRCTRSWVFTAPVLGVIERGSALELRPRFEMSGWRPAVVHERRGRSSSPLDIDRLDKGVRTIAVRRLC
jgi:hypothetical protein